MKRPWLIAASLHWCKQCGVPLLEPRCGRCGGEASRLHASPPRDVRPAFQLDAKRAAETIKAELGAEALKALLPRGCLALMNKVAYVDQADEVIVGGWPVGVLYYNPEQGRWRFKPAPEGTARMWRSEAGHWAQLKRDVVKQWQLISLSELSRRELPDREGGYVYLVSSLGLTVGLAVWTGEALKVVKTWSPQKPHGSPRQASWRDAVEANEEALLRAESRARAFIARVSKRFSKPRLVSFSGGKDSLACLLLCLKELGGAPLLFNDTGLELPETVKYVEEVASRLGLELMLASAGDAFWRSLPSFGPPARDYRWCCKICKLVPIAKLLRKQLHEGPLTFLGQRRLESFARARSPPVAVSRWVKGSVTASPINEWTALQVWLYLMREGAEPNPLYSKGFDRIGCWLCPASELAELRLVAELHPDLWGQWESWLTSWASQQGLPLGWVRLGLWRWRRLPGDQRRLAARMGVEEPKLHTPMEVSVKLSPGACMGEVMLEAEVRPIPELSVLASLAPTVKARAVELGPALLLKSDSWSATLRGSRVRVRGLSVEDVEEGLSSTAKLVARSTLCSHCGSCVAHCPVGCAHLEDGPRVDVDGCVGCGACNQACPAVVYAASEAVRRALPHRLKSR